MAEMFLLYLIALIVQVQTQIRILPTKRANTVLTNILSNYSDYEVLIHLDNKTIQETNIFIENLHSSLQITLLLNYDMANFFERPTGYKFLNIVFLSNTFQFTHFSEVIINLEHNDVVLILSEIDISNKIIRQNEKSLYFWQQKGFKRAGSVFVLDLLMNDLYYQCFYCGKMSGVLRKISSGEAIAPVRNYLNNFSDFHDQKFTVGYMSYLPYFSYKDSKNYYIGGPEGELLKMLSKMLNFRYILKNFEGYVSEWHAMVEAVHYNKLDWAVGGISSSPERAALADLTRHIHIETYTALFCSSTSDWNSWQQILLPFEMSLWFCICIMLMIIPFLLKNASDNLVDKSSNTIFDFFEATILHSISFWVQVVIRGLVDQPLHRLLAENMAKRFLLITWWYFSIIIATAYRSKLASSLIHPYNVQPNSLKELLLNGYSFQVNQEDWSVLKENLLGSIDYTHQEVLKNSNDKLNVCSSIQQTVKGKTAVIDEEFSLQYETTTNCRVLLNPEDFLDLRVIGEEVFPSHHIWPLQLGAPYRHKFSKVIEDLHSSGILHQWYSLASRKRIPSSYHYRDVEAGNALKFSTMFAPILILCVGLLLATIVFLIEMAYFNLSRVIDFYKNRTQSVKN